LLPDGLGDSFRKAGRGLGNTITNEYPVSRIDYIWIDRGIHAHAVVAKRTDHSDHRMVIADLSFGG
jgi:endonuclease/exonuclease/phosphatase (EEP) superfamily protein YafD